jgi:TRAP-type C4-dicarboxylate transport system permease small subunit
MKTIQSFLDGASQLCVTLAKGLILLFMAGISVVIIAQVFSRYVLQNSISWSEELARYLMIWMALVGASVAFRHGAHVGINLLVDRLSKRIRPWAFLLAKAVIATFLLVLIREGVALGAFFASQKSPAMEISMLWAYSGFFVGGIFMAVHLLRLVLGDVELILKN